MTRSDDVVRPTPAYSAGVSVELGEHPRRIGHYRILRLLGQGGMGVVYLAEQTEPVRREVALKVLKTGGGSELVLARFETERQALAVMEHPGITKVYDAGITENGWPYFVMERVGGVPLTEYADTHRLTIAERIALFVQVCRAVQHAHHKGIIHRDLKPSNVLVAETDGVPQCKVIDFGIAKAMETADTERLTATGLTHGTPAYMSPEQGFGDGIDVDTRSDVYSLGVLLYELLAGVLPFDPDVFRGLALVAQHASVEPPSPGTRFAALSAPDQQRLAALRRTEPAALRRVLDGDLRWIVLQALEKERERRYETPNSFAEDLEHHLADEPVVARPPTGTYRARKFVRRHRGGVAFAASIAVLLVGFSAAVTVQAQRLARARATAVARQAQAEDLVSFMLGDLHGRLATVGRLDLLDDVGKKALAYFAAVRESELTDGELYRRSEALRQLGQVRVEQGDLDAAMHVFAQSLALAEPLARRDPLNGQWQLGLGASHFWVGFIEWRHNEYERALSHFVPYLRITQALVARAPDSLTYRQELAEANSNIGSVKESQGDLRGALEAFRATLALKDDLVRRAPANVDFLLDLGHTYNTVAVAQRKLGDLADAERSFRAELATRETLVARDSGNQSYQRYAASSHVFVGQVLLARGDVRGAIAEMGAGRAMQARVAARDTANAEMQWLLAIAEQGLGSTLLEAGETAAALATLQGAMARFAAVSAGAPTNRPWKADLARSRMLTGQALHAAGRAAEALAMERLALATLDTTLVHRPGDQLLRETVTEAYLTLGDVLAREHDAPGAARAWARALTTIDSTARATATTDQVALRGEALLRLRHTNEARPVIAELERRGYRRPRWIALVHVPRRTPSP